jgi:hypothetical protein
MPSFTVTIDGQTYKTEATSKKAAEKKIKDHLKKDKKTSKPTKEKTKTTGSMTKKIIDYKIISNQNEHSLTTTVKGYIRDGWQPQGGIGVVDYQGKGMIGGIGRYEFYQAIVKYSKYK